MITLSISGATEVAASCHAIAFISKDAIILYRHWSSIFSHRRLLGDKDKKTRKPAISCFSVFVKFAWPRYDRIARDPQVEVIICHTESFFAVLYNFTFDILHWHW